LASTVLNLSAVVLAVTGLLCFVFAGLLVRGIVAPGAAPEAQELTIKIMRLLLLSPVFLGLGIAAKGILEGQDRFTLPAFAPVLYNLATILGALILGERIGIYGVAIGVVVGAVLYLLIEVPGLIRTGMRYRPRIDFHTPGLHEVGRLLGPRVIGQAAFQINFIVITRLSWRVSEATVSGLNYAWQLLMLPHGVIALSISTVIFPTMSRLYQTNDLSGMRTAFGQALKPLIFLSVPAAVMLFFFRVPIVQTILQGGAFDASSTALVSAMLAWFAVGLLGYALVEVLTRAFYAMHDTKTPVVIGIAIIVVNILLAMALVDVMGGPALALSLSASTTIEAVALAILLRRRLGSPSADDAAWAAKIFAMAVVVAIATFLLAPWLTRETDPVAGQRWAGAGLLALSVIGVGLGYLVLAWLLRIPELRLGVEMVRSRARPVRQEETVA
ncbi:MAG: murein biosynthesis integral membrane protein MurJ, partial [Chloroflexota bacterium]